MLPRELRAEFLGGLALLWKETEGQAPRALPRLPTAKSQSLLAYLLLHRTQTHTRERLMAMFWPDRPEPRARRSLSTALWHLRRCLPAAEAIQANSQFVHFAPPAPLWVDIEALEALAARPDLDSLEAARALYRGQVLEGLYDDWIVDERYRVQELYLQVLSRLMTLYAEHGRPADALEAAQHLLRENPLREDAHRAAMLAYARLGQRTAALEQFEACRSHLQADLAAEPAPETIALRQAILDGHITATESAPAARTRPAAPPRAVRHAATSSPLGPLAGRAEALSTLEARWAAARSGQGGLVLVHGEAGIGKTRLAEALAEAARVHGGRVLWGRCFEFERMLPYQPVAEALRPLLAGFEAEEWDRLPPWAASALARLLPGLTSGPASAAMTAGGSGLDATRLFEALALCLSQAAARWPILLVLDDLHWASDSSFQLLHYLARRLGQAPVLCVCTYRRDAGRRQHALAAFAGQVEKDRLGQLLPLERLPAAAVTDWVQRQSGLGEAAAPLSAWLFQETLGNPFFMVETVTTLFETGRLTIEQGIWGGDFARISGGESPLPDRIRAAVQDRAGRLDQPAQAALRLAAVLGREFDFDAFDAAWGQGSDSALEVLENLSRHGLIEEGRGQAGRDYAFSHHKIQESLYQGTPRRRRQRLHAQAATVMEALYAQNLDDAAPELAHHYDQARRLDKSLVVKAVAYLRRAGEAAEARFALSEAVAYYGRALDLAAEPAERFALLGAREAVWGTQGDRPAQARDVGALEALAPSLDAEARAEAALRRAAYESVIGHYDQAITAAQAALAESAQAPALAARARQQWGMACFHSGDSATAQTQFEAARALAQSANLPRQEGDALMGLSLAAWKQGRYADISEHALAARAIFRRIGYTRGEGNVLQQLGIAARYQDQYLVAREYFEAGLRAWRLIGERRGEGYALTNLGVVSADVADYPAARGYFEQALRIWREIVNPDGEYNVLGNLAAADYRLGSFQAGLDHARQALEISRRIGNRQGEGVTLCIQGYLEIELNDLDAASASLDAALEISLALPDRHNEAQIRDGLGRVAVARGDLRAATAELEQAIAMAGELGEQANQSEALAHLAQVSLRQGLPQLALEQSQRSLDLAVSIGARAVQAEALLVMARAHEALEAWPAAQAAYSEARSLFNMLHFHHRLSEAADGLARTAARLEASAS